MPAKVPSEVLLVIRIAFALRARLSLHRDVWFETLGVVILNYSSRFRDTPVPSNHPSPQIDDTHLSALMSFSFIHVSSSFSLWCSGGRARQRCGRGLSLIPSTCRTPGELGPDASSAPPQLGSFGGQLIRRGHMERRRMGPWHDVDGAGIEAGGMEEQEEGER